jgi:plastocyanin
MPIAERVELLEIPFAHAGLFAQHATRGEFERAIECRFERTARDAWPAVAGKRQHLRRIVVNADHDRIDPQPCRNFLGHVAHVRRGDGWPRRARASWRVREARMRMKLAPIVACALAFAASTLPATAATYRGVATAPSVVWITGTPPAPDPNAAIHQTMKSFVPSMIVVPVGGSVRFPNDDAFYHSVYSVSPSNPFDLGLYDTGPGKSVEFDTTGIVEVRCHVHGSMRATIVVVDGPYATTLKPGERYRIDGVARGPHVLHVWTAGLDVTTTPIVVR